jgi:UDPglucose 6-dehydrogenase
VTAALGGSVQGKKVGILGLAFKQNTDDMRDAASVPLVNALIEAGAEVVAFDPAAMENAGALMPGLTFASRAADVAEGADAVVVVTEWDEFRALDLEKLAKRMRGRALVDLRNVYDAAEAERAGLQYQGMGRGTPTAAAALRAAAE